MTLRPNCNVRVALRAIEARRVGSSTSNTRHRALHNACVAFVASDKGVLQRVLREKGAVIDSEGLEALRRLPETFREWISMPPERRFKAGHSAISGVVVGRIAPAPERSRDRAKNAA